MRRSRGGAAFYVETLLLVLFLLASLTVLVQILGAAKRTSREARELSTAVNIAQNAAELFAASGSQEAVSYTHLRAHETRHDLVCRLLLEKKNISETTRRTPNTKTVIGKKKQTNGMIDKKTTVEKENQRKTQISRAL